MAGGGGAPAGHAGDSAGVGGSAGDSGRPGEPFGGAGGEAPPESSGTAGAALGDDGGKGGLVAGQGGGGRAGSGGDLAGGRSGGSVGGRAGASGAVAAGGEGGLAELPDLATAIHIQADAVCAKRDECWATSIISFFGGAEGCAERVEAYYSWVSGLPGNEWDSEAHLACAEAWTSTTCEDLAGAAIPECLPAGSRRDGERCNDPHQCASLYCSHDGWSCGICAPTPEPGNACSRAWDCGEGGLECFAGECVRPRQPGEECDDRAPCRGDLFCSTGQCAPLPSTVGEHCDPTYNCDTWKGLVCDAATEACVPIAWREPGEPCGVVTGGEALFCSNQGLCEDDTCHAGAADGQACDDTEGPLCTWPARCIESVCVPPPDEGLCCPDGQDSCDGTCVDVATDPDHCGGCGQGCAESDSCSNGECRVTYSSYCAEFSTATCQRLDECGTLYDTCQAEVVAFCCSTVICADVSPLSRERLDPCVQAFDDFDCGALDQGELPEACQNLF